MKLEGKSSRFLEEGLLFMRGFNRIPLKCIASNKVTKVFKEFTREIAVSIKGTPDYSSNTSIWVIVGFPWKLMLLLSLEDAKHVNLIITNPCSYS